MRRWWAAAAAVVLVSGCGSERPAVADPPAPDPESVTLLATGDVLAHQDRVLTAGAEQPDGS